MGQVRILILGGTVFLGRTVATIAAARGHQVTCAARGTAAPAPDECRFVALDRDRADGLDPVTGRRWDAVVDVARQPGQVSRAVKALAPTAASYVFVSTASVYPDWTVPVITETTPTVEPLQGDEADIAQFAEGKVACERSVLSVFGPSRATIVRAGLIGGPGDRSGRSGYWPWRFAHPSGPEVLVPAADDQISQLIDVRDLAAWIVGVCEERIAGIFLADGPVTTLGETLAAAQKAVGADIPSVPVPEEWLLSHDVSPWMGPRSLPLWFGDRTQVARFDTSAAARAGLRCRPLTETFAAALDYGAMMHAGGRCVAGLSDEDERALMAAWTPPSSRHEAHISPVS